MSVFGTGISKFVGTGDPGIDTVELPYSEIETDWVVPNQINRTSILTGLRDFRAKGSYSEFTVKINLFKIPVLADRQQKAIDVLEYKLKDVKFFPYVNDAGGSPISNPVKDELGADATFRIMDVRFPLIGAGHDLDVMLIDFNSKQLTDPGASIQ